jgi:TetR/AcrR family transcriptional repressor of mexJK operon
MAANTKADEIRTAARRLFLRYGLRGTSMDAIAEEANVSKQTLYRHYGSKDQLFVGVLVSMTSDRLRQDVADLLPTYQLTRPELADALVGVARAIVDFLLAPEYLALMRVVIAEVRDFPELAATFRSSVVVRGAAALANLLSSQHVAPLVSVRDLEPALRVFVGPLLSYLLEALLEDPVAVRRRAYAEIPGIVELFMAAVAPLPAPPAGRPASRDGRGRSK